MLTSREGGENAIWPNFFLCGVVLHQSAPLGQVYKALAGPVPATAA
jgi:hypothetical protein